MVCVVQYESEMAHYGSMDGGPHAGPMGYEGHRAMSSHLPPPSPSFSSMSGGLHPYSSYSSSSTAMPSMMNTGHSDNQAKRDKDAIYGSVDACVTVAFVALLIHLL